MLSIRFLVILLIIASNITSCKSKSSNEDIISPAVSIYENALAKLEKEKYKAAAEEFANVYYQHPGSQITPYAELMEAYSYYLANYYQDTIDILDNFIKLHPLHEDIAYAYYLKALAAFNQLSDVYYDQSNTLIANTALEDVAHKFPGTPYADDAVNKIAITKDYLAAKDMEIGKYYAIARNNPIAAIGRFQSAIKYNTHHSPEAMYRLAESCLMIGLAKEAQNYASELKNKFPGDAWSIKAAQNLKFNLENVN